jgi:hypothetical protein
MSEWKAIIVTGASSDFGARVRQWLYPRIGYADLLSVGRPETPK